MCDGELDVTWHLKGGDMGVIWRRIVRWISRCSCYNIWRVVDTWVDVVEGGRPFSWDLSAFIKGPEEGATLPLQPSPYILHLNISCPSKAEDSSSQVVEPSNMNAALELVSGPWMLHFPMKPSHYQQSHLCKINTAWHVFGSDAPTSHFTNFICESRSIQYVFWGFPGIGTFLSE